MEKQPLVSIITPTYNHESFIGQCIESVLAQTYPYWEQIVIDDGSTDKTGEIVAQYKDGRIKYIGQNHVGIWRLGKTYNKALHYAQGEFIAILEGDDFWPSYKLERQLPAFERQEVVISWGRSAVTNSKGETIWIMPKNLKWFKTRTKEEILRRLLLEDFMPACTVMCRKGALLLIGGFRQPEYSPFVDYPTWLELGLIGDFCPVDEILGYRRRHKQQVQATMVMATTKGSRCSIDFLEKMPQELKESIGIKASEVLVAYQQRIAGAFSILGKRALVESKWQEARRNFKQSLSKGSLTIRLESLLGLTCSYLGVDLEWAAAIRAMIMRRPRLK